MTFWKGNVAVIFSEIEVGIILAQETKSTLNEFIVLNHILKEMSTCLFTSTFLIINFFS